MTNRNLKYRLWPREGPGCHYCGATMVFDEATVDHRDPDGGNTLTNIVLACRRCNASKHNKSLFTFLMQADWTHSLGAWWLPDRTKW